MKKVLKFNFTSGSEVSMELRRDIYPNTELGIDLKLLTCKPGRLPVEAMLDGMLIHDDENHYTFTENALEKKVANPRNPHVYMGKHINVLKKDDGTLFLTFNRPHYTESFTFRNFCKEAAEELLIVAGLTEKEAAAI